MQLSATVVVLGMVRAKGEFEGTPYDSTKIFVEDTLGSDNPDVRGTSVVSYKIGTFDEFAKYAHLPFPIRAEVTIESVATGKGGSRQTVKSFKPITDGQKKAA